MSHLAKNTYTLTGTRFAWIQLIAAGVITEKWRFDNLQKATVKFPKTGSDTGGENIDITFGDGLLMRFPKENRILSAIDLVDDDALADTEKEVTPADASSDATNKCTITITVNGAPLELNSKTAFLADLLANKDALFLVTIGTGMSYTAKSVNKKPEGYVHCIYKLNSDIDDTYDSNHNPQTLEFVSYKNSGLTAGDLTVEDLFTPMTWKLGGAGKDVTGIVPPDLVTLKETSLLAGDPVIITDITYS